jgi:hypothetical protein
LELTGICHRGLRDRITSSLSPLLGSTFPASVPTAYAVGCILAPLRGY